MSISPPKVHDCTAKGPFKTELTTSQVSGIMSLSDPWPLDRFIVGDGSIVLEVNGDDYWTIYDTKTGESLRRRSGQ